MLMNMVVHDSSMKVDEIVKTERTLKDLNLTDDFLFDVITENLENCKYIIELSLGIELKDLRWKQNQKVIHNIPGKRGIRMDFIAESMAGELFDVEMQKRNEGNIPKRTRFYQALNDSPMLKSGERGFDNLKPMFIIVICDFDLYGRGLYRYTFDNRCKELPDLIMGDECTKCILNTKGKIKKDVESSLIDFLHYISDSKSVDLEKVCDKRLQKLHANVQVIKDNAEMEAEFMKAEERERQIREDGKKEGIKEGMREHERFMNLTQRLLSDKRYDELQRATEDQNYCQQLYKEYNIL